MVWMDGVGEWCGCMVWVWMDGMGGGVGESWLLEWVDGMC
jgi:hypothetical protein